MSTKKLNGLPRLFLVRHGDTDWSDSGQHTGRTDIPLNARGERRAVQLASRLKDETFAAVFTSPLIRARQTCDLAGFSSRAQIDSDLTEWSYGEYDGRTSADIHRERENWNLFRDGAPGGESPDQVAARADRFLKVVRSIDGDVVAFSSGHIIRMIAARWLGFAPFDARFFYTATASVGILGYEHDRNQPAILLWNEIQTCRD